MLYCLEVDRQAKSKVFLAKVQPSSCNASKKLYPAATTSTRNRSTVEGGACAVTPWPRGSWWTLRPCCVPRARPPNLKTQSHVYLTPPEPAIGSPHLERATVGRHPLAPAEGISRGERKQWQVPAKVPSPFILHLPQRLTGRLADWDAAAAVSSVGSHFTQATAPSRRSEYKFS